MAAPLRHPPRPRVAGALACSLLAVAPGAGTAETPAFDRPGIAFSPETLPRGGFAWEQGLSDFQRDRVDGVQDKVYAASMRLRYGVGERWEVELAAPLFQQIESRGEGVAFRTAGTGDLSIAAKARLGSTEGPWQAALLGVVSFPTANDELSLDDEQYSLGGTLAWSSGTDHSLALYANVDLLEGDATWTLSPSWSFPIGKTVGGFVEAAFQPPAHGDPSNTVAGGGVTWLVRPRVQLDAYFLAGLTEAATDLAAGCGFSVYWP